MPLTKSVIKRMKQSEIANKRNSSTKKAYKVAEKKIIQNIEKGENDSNSKELLKSLFSKLDIAVKKKVIHKNKAARKKSQIAKKLSVKFR